MKFERTIFVTGFPGFIAERLVGRLARPENQIYLLVERSMTERAMLAIERIAAQSETPLENFALVTGDITLENLGIDADDGRTLVGEVREVFHLAAVYDLAVDRATARRVNLAGTTNVGSFVKQLQNLKRYNYVSTCYVAGRRTGVIGEDELAHGAGFRNYYEETKYLAEIEVEKLKTELPVTIFRPSVVVGDSATGETAKYDGIYYLIKYLMRAPAMLRLANVGNKAVRLNLVPVDFVADAIGALAADEQAIGQTIALADPSPLATAELFDAIALRLSGKKSVFTPPSTLVYKALMLPFSPSLTGLPTAAVPYFFIAQTYDTSNASRLLARHNISCPRFTDYLGNLLDFVKKHPQTPLL